MSLREISDSQAHEKLIEAIMKKYRPPKGELINESLMTINDFKQIGLERIAQNLLKLSNGRFTELKMVKEPKK